MSIVAAAEVKFDKVEYLQPKVEGQKKTDHPVKGHILLIRIGELSNFRTKRIHRWSQFLMTRC
jgi:hypothetical protein